MVKATARFLVESNGNEVLATDREFVLGSRTGCDVVLDDPIVADRHCRFLWDDGFRVRDLGSVTGTWVDGEAASPSAELKDGSQVVIGTTRLAVRIEPREGSPTLVLDVQRGAFFWKKPGKGVFDNDPDAWVRSEVEFGRFRALQAGNRLAILLAVVLLVAGTFVGAVLEPLADPGPLQLPHAAVVEAGAHGPTHAAFGDFAKLAGDQGCNVCHTTGQGTPAQKCLQCHEDLRQPASWRHPWLGDGELQPLPGQAAGEGFCTLCHTDHQGSDALKPASHDLLGTCDACHGIAGQPFDAAALVAKAPVALPPARKREYATYRFPHDVHIGKEIACAVCHTLDPSVQERRAQGLPDDPDREDFTTVPYETCAGCHVPGAPLPASLTAAQRDRWRAKDHQWRVGWHGTDDGGRHCKQCHDEQVRDGQATFGPSLRTVARPRLTVDELAATGALYTADRRQHAGEFAAHAAGRECKSCHQRGGLSADVGPEARTFWHALHVGPGALAPAAGAGAAASLDATQGCVSCHGDLRTAKGLHAATGGSYAWPSGAEAQQACRECHQEGDRQLLLQAVPTPVPADRTAAAPDFPHGVHLASEGFGKVGSSLAEGCFSCHEFAAPAGGETFRQVPRTKPGAADCTQCHSGHADIAGGSCEQCHPSEAGRSNSFLLSARVAVGSMVGGRAVPGPPTRDWPAKNPFSHLSRGHSGPEVGCDACHEVDGVRGAKTLEQVKVPDEAVGACRECHLKQQFHWR